MLVAEYPENETKTIFGSVFEIATHVGVTAVGKPVEQAVKEVPPLVDFDTAFVPDFNAYIIWLLLGAIANSTILPVPVGKKRIDEEERESTSR